MNKKIIGVIGGRSVTDDLLAAAEEVGRRAADMGFSIICGGLTGVMEAASKGAKEAGGLTIGVIPQDDKSHANRYIDVPIATGMGIGRNVIIARTADVLIAVGGEYGTLSEIAFALQLGKPVIGIDSWDIKGVVKADNAEDAVVRAVSLIGPDIQ